MTLRDFRDRLETKRIFAHDLTTIILALQARPHRDMGLISALDDILEDMLEDERDEAYQNGERVVIWRDTGAFVR